MRGLRIKVKGMSAGAGYIHHRFCKHTSADMSACLMSAAALHKVEQDGPISTRNGSCALARESAGIVLSCSTTCRVLGNIRNTAKICTGSAGLDMAHPQDRVFVTSTGHEVPAILPDQHSGHKLQACTQSDGCKVLVTPRRIILKYQTQPTGKGASQALSTGVTCCAMRALA